MTVSSRTAPTLLLLPKAPTAHLFDCPRPGRLTHWSPPQGLIDCLVLTRLVNTPVLAAESAVITAQFPQFACFSPWLFFHLIISSLLFVYMRTRLELPPHLAPKTSLVAEDTFCLWSSKSGPSVDRGSAARALGLGAGRCELCRGLDIIHDDACGHNVHRAQLSAMDTWPLGVAWYTWAGRRRAGWVI